jgi:hypothetical protein
MTAEDFFIKDQETTSLWDLRTGECIKGELEGKKLIDIQVLDAFWFAWSSFYPNTQVLD